MNSSIRRRLATRKRRIEHRLNKFKNEGCEQPMLWPANIQCKLTERTRGMAYGGIGSMLLLVRQLGLAKTLDGRHELFDLVVVALCGTIAGADSWTDIERFGRERLGWLRTFLRLAGGIPSHDTFGRVFAMLDPAGLVACIRQWLAEVGRQRGQHIAIDGKTLRGSFDTAASRSPLHLVSTWASDSRLTLGQVAVDTKSNEITAIPLLLELLELKEATVTLDAMGCLKEIAQQIVDRGGQYVLALKDNQPKLQEAVAAEFNQVLAAEARPRGLRRQVTVETSHGRRQRRDGYVLPALQTQSGAADWVKIVE